MDVQNQSKPDAQESSNGSVGQQNKMKETKYKLNPIRFALTKFTIYETKSVSRKLQRKLIP